jgi:23S rRNA (cytidine1920-2'-O)/16S rRNA (cytidine1409-2'-O)-methyltransferase
MHPSLRHNKQVELHEKTDIRDFYMNEMPDIIVIDVSFISLRDVLPHIYNHLSVESTQVVAMVKPQFEAGKGQTNKGIIKNDAMRRQILRDFEDWSRKYFTIQNKRDSDVAGAKGNQERFYLLQPLKK